MPVVSRSPGEAAVLRERAARVLAGGVSSDARRLPNGTLFVDRAEGAHLYDVDGKRYIDYVLGQGPALLGHAAGPVADAVAAQVRRGVSYSAQHRDEVELAETLVRVVPGAEKVRFNSVGSEAVHGALRLARGHTGRSKVVKFEGHYHGWLDPVLYSVHPPVDAAGPARQPRPVPGTGGQQLSSAGDLLLAPWNDLDALTELMERHGDDVAAVIMEPVLCNTGVIMPAEGYLEAVHDLCRRTGALLVFDEVITGFRLSLGGAQEYLGVTPDLAVFGKAIAGGMQLSAFAGRADVMDRISSGQVAHAGTFNSHPVAVAAARATLEVLERDRDVIYPRVFHLGALLAEGLREAAREAGVPLLVTGPGPMIQTYVTDAGDVRDYRDFARTDLAAAARLHGLLMDRGVNIVPRGLWFLSTAHTEEDVTETVAAAADALRAL
ncbi:aspartate aminotransferase family protein [Jiangella rhizosphaerae]|uniref:glutamate-1-semialdehyde 2,1-aminomutase n=1 Tax=Jiangella rhizosphaerae TaxID=2293569 RepID=A0A418KM57_9ACTN|nr:aspartate aminotransferase family protein [Jiangella rhizosphaerae]RIQ19015.1 aspartate aminotransferase family protein [Jiangella rhizosphaerae]